MEPQSFKTNRWVVCCLIAGLAIVAYAEGKYAVIWDSATYLAYADNFLNGRGMVDPTGLAADGRPVLVALLAGLQALIGQTPWTMAVFDVLAAAALLVGLFLVLDRLTGLAPALVGTAAFGLAPGIIGFGTRGVDPVWPAFLLLAIAAWLAAGDAETRRGRWIGLAAAGLLVALAIQTKSVAALVLIYFGLVAVIDRAPGGWRGGLAFAAVALGGTALIGVATAAPDDTVTAASARQLAALLQRFDAGLWAGLSELTALVVAGIADYLNLTPRITSLTFYFPAWPVGLAALLLLISPAVRGHRAARHAWALTLVFLPLTLYTNAFDMRVGQNLMQPIALVLALAAGLAWLGRWLSGRSTWAGAAALAALVLVAAQWWVTPSGQTSRVLEANLVLRLVTGAPIQAQANGDGLARWIQADPGRIDPARNGVIFTAIDQQHMVSFLTDREIRIFNLPYYQFGEAIHWPYYPPARGSLETPGFLTAPYFRPARALNAPFTYLSAPALADLIQRERIGYIAIHARPRVGPLTTWLRQGFRLEPVETFDDPRYTTTLYRITPTAPDSPPTFSADSTALAYLDHLRETNPDDFRVARRALVEEAGIDPALIETLMAREAGDRELVTP